MHSRPLSYNVEQEIEERTMDLGSDVSDVAIHYPGVVRKILRQIAEAGDLVLGEITKADDWDKVDWRAEGGKPCLEPCVLGQLDDKLEDLLNYLWDRNNRRAYIFAVVNLAEQLQLVASPVVKRKKPVVKRQHPSR